MSIYIFFAAGLFLSVIGWISFGLIRNTFLRVLLQTGFVSVSVTPSIIGGDGVAPAPAFLIMAWKGHFLMGMYMIALPSCLLGLTGEMVAEGKIQERDQETEDLRSTDIDRQSRR